MDSYICTEVLNRENRHYSVKMENLICLNYHYDSRSETLNVYPAKIIVQTTDECNLSWYEYWLNTNETVYPDYPSTVLAIVNMLENKFYDIWNWQLYKQIRKGIGKGMLIWNCRGFGMLYEKVEDHQRVPEGPENFLSKNYRKNNVNISEIWWSARMKQFDINRGWNR
ncbi:hypothetical protein [Methanosalsum natronophilum]|uniref:hypothetical protein n=1 Tax=Methanosalsum natronophilum TaxID=768733 RepID=UPI002169A938|nr:hypothetical protein [Methanosalsum natronophilum]MCS3923593.1 hypothetical protein [Methanosalsum natronophilum]